MPATATLTFFPPTIDNQAGLATLALDDDGVIQDCSSACERIFGYRQRELLGRHVSLLLPMLEDMNLVIHDHINPRLSYLCRCAIPFQARQRDGRSFASQLFFNRLNGEKLGLRVIVRKLESLVS